MFNELWVTLQLLFDIMMLHLADAAQVVAFVGNQNNQGQPRTDMQVYLIGLRRLAIIAIIFPIPILILGILGHWVAVISTAGLLWAIFTIILLTLATPIGLLLEATVGGMKDSGKRYVNLVLGVLLTELVFTLFVAVVPINNNPNALPIVILAAAILGILGVTGTKTMATKKRIGTIAGLVLIIFTFSFFFPQTFQCLQGIRERVDNEVAGACSPTAYSKPIKQQTEKFVVAHPGQWTNNISSPPNAHVRIIPESWIWIKTWDGRVYADGPGQTKWLGDNIPDANMQFASAMRTPVRVRILTQPK